MIALKQRSHVLNIGEIRHIGFARRRNNHCVYAVYVLDFGPYLYQCVVAAQRREEEMMKRPYVYVFSLLAVAWLLLAAPTATSGVTEPPDLSFLALRRPPVLEIVAWPPMTTVHWSEMFHGPAKEWRDRFRGEYEDKCAYQSGIKSMRCSLRVRVRA